MSQGKKQSPDEGWFVITGGVYGHIPKTHFYEQLGRVLDLSFVRELTKPLYAQKLGRPSLDPVVFFKCMLVGFFENIIYDTELEFRIADSLLIRRFLGYGLDERTPDESTLRKTRQRMPEEVFRKVFERVLSVCKDRGLLKGRAIGTDSTQVDANASMDSLQHKTLGCTYEEYVLALRRQDSPDATKSEAKEADKDRKGKASNTFWQSKTDPESRIMQHADGHTHLSYKVDATVDLETGVIVSGGASPANTSDQGDMLQRLDETVAQMEELGLSPEVVVADKGHHSGENLAGTEERGITALISSMSGKAGRPGFEREDFSYDAEKDCLVCPADQELRRIASPNPSRKYYKAKGRICQACPHFGRCTKSKGGRAVGISLYEEQVLANRERVHSEDARPLMQIRRQRGEAPFAYFKGYGGLRRFSGRGLAFATKKTIVAMAGWNLLLIVKAMMSGDTLGTVISALVRLVLAIIGRLRLAFGATQTAIADKWENSPQPTHHLCTFSLKTLLSEGC